MKQRIHLITLAVGDFERSLKFYTEILGWQPASLNDDIVFFDLGNGIQLALYPREKLAEDATVSPQGSGFPGFTLSHNTRSEAEVDEIIQQLESKGVTIVKQPQKVFWGGYSSYFADPDGHLWEVAYNPFWVFDEAGNLKLD